ncbi:ankyrin repeat and SOCS box protein 3-like [Haliotis rubra]|uniref:ankyrin repeat and SOCS box protein 3-like n=1 Tax=Haliotis rubra TaxID=36100 RepID=UPI001EE5AFFB|nr:ankyrin repeat and SOCS box protein 3-like [Haliotis rubra]
MTLSLRVGPAKDFNSPEDTCVDPRDDIMEALTEAIRNNDVDRVQSLLDSGEITDIDEVYDVLTPLCEACHVNARDVALLLLSSGARVNAPSKSLAKRPLHIACDTAEDRVNLIECLLEAGCDINAQDEDGNTALHLACTHANFEVTRLLLNLGADVTLEDVDGETALLRSCYAGEDTLIQMLLEHGSDPAQRNGTCLLTCILRNNFKGVYKLFKLCPDLELTDVWMTQPVEPRVTPYMEVMTEYDQRPGVWGTERSIQLADLTEAVKQGDHDAVRDYLETHTGPEKLDYVVPLTTACMLGNTDIVRLFISHGVDVSKISRLIPNHQSHTPVIYWPLIQASRSGSAELVQCLLQEGCDVDVWDQNGDTSLMHACEKGHMAVARLLIESGADVNHQNMEYTSPLVQATTCTEPELIRLLLEAGSDPTVLCGVCLQNCIVNNNLVGVGLLYTVYKDCVDDDGLKAKLRLLTARKELTNVNVSWLGSNYSTIPALHFACGMDKVDSWKTVEVILKLGADVRAVHGAGFSCLQYACSSVNVRTIHLLLANGVYSERVGWRSLWTVFPSLSREHEPDYLKALKLLVMAGFRMDEESARVFSAAVEKSDLSDKGKMKLSAFIHESSSTPLRLTSLCRIKIRQCVPVNIDLNIERLDDRLPAAFLDYLRFSDVLEAS